MVTSAPKSAELPIVPTTSMLLEFFASATTSLPLNVRLPEVWSACARIVALALVFAMTKTSPLAIVPVSVTVVGEVPPLA